MWAFSSDSSLCKAEWITSKSVLIDDTSFLRLELWISADILSESIPKLSAVHISEMRVAMSKHPGTKESKNNLKWSNGRCQIWWRSVNPYYDRKSLNVRSFIAVIFSCAYSGTSQYFFHSKGQLSATTCHDCREKSAKLSNFCQRESAHWRNTTDFHRLSAGFYNTITVQNYSNEIYGQIILLKFNRLTFRLLQVQQ